MPSDTSALPERLRRQPALVFIDESGQFRAPHPAEPQEHGLVVCVYFRDTSENRSRIQSVADELRRRHGRVVKGRRLGDGDYQLVGDLVRDIGYIAQVGVYFDSAHVESCRKMLTETAREIEAAQPRTARDTALLSAMRRTQQQIDAAIDRNLSTYIVHVVHLLRVVATWFRNNGMFPDLRVTFDEKLMPDDQELAAFLPRFAVSTVFHELFATRLGALWDSAAATTGDVSTDDRCAGLVVADAVAFALGCIQRGQDTTGFLGRQFDRCSRDHD